MQNKSKKFVALATYVVAVLCLLAGLFLPLFNGKEILALKLGEVFKSLLKKETSFSLPYMINLFGIESVKFDFMALVIVLYAAVTALALLSFIPVVFSVRKEGKAAKKFYYGIEIAAVIVLSLLLTVTLLGNNICYNIIIAFGGTVLALIVLSGLDKGKASVIKIVLFILSAIGFLALFDYVVLLSKQDAFVSFTDKITSAMVKDKSGADYLTDLFADKLTLSGDAKNKALVLLSVITATVVLINFFIDAVKLGTGKDKKPGRIFDIARYGLEFAAAVCVLVTALIIDKTSLGLMLIIILAVAAIQLAVVIIRFIAGVLKKSDNERVDDIEDEAVDNEISANTVIDIDNVTDDGYKPVDDYKPEDFNEDKFDYSDDGYTAPTEDDYKDEYEEPKYEEETIQPVEEEKTVEEPTAPAEETEHPNEPAEIFYEPDEDSAYILPSEEAVDEEEKPAEKEVETQAEPEAVEEAEAETEEAEVEEEPLAAETTEVAVEPVAEVKEEAEAEEEEIVQKPYSEMIKPYNPYERHNNPFRAFEQSSQTVQPYNPYRQQEKPVQPEKRVEKVQPARPAYEQKPVQPFKPAEKPQGVRPLQPRPIIQEFKPVPPISEQPPKEPQVYTIDTIYAGPVDDFIRKLSNDERIEFAKTFIEKNRGNLGSIPDYVVGGDNKKFFSVAFIYLGRIRGLVSDGLLNKMYKELNLL